MGSEYKAKRLLDSIEIAHPIGIFTYNAYDSLKYLGHCYAKDVADFIPFLEPLKTQKGLIAKRQPRPPPKQPANWWKAQCVFEQALRGHESDPLSERMKDILEQAREEYRVKNNEALEERWQMKLLNEQKFEEDPKRYLAEVFKKGEKSKNIVMLKTKRPWRIEKAAEQSLECEYTTAPPDLEKALEDSSDDEDEEGNNCIVVVGQNKGEVAEKIRSFQRETQRIRREIHDVKEERKRKRQKEIETALSKCKDWDVTGTWEISCPHIEEGWNAKNLTLKIFREDSQMWAKFNFGAITGVFRFERHDDEPAKPRISKKSRDDDSDEKCSDEEDEEGEDDFYLGKISQPSKKYPTWNYRYRGEERGEGMIEIGSDNDLYSITFLGRKGRTLECEFGGGAFEDCEFSGVKVAVGTEPDTDIADEWRDRNYAAYERARVNRWR